jgi:hypothetical protein
MGLLLAGQDGGAAVLVLARRNFILSVELEEFLKPGFPALGVERGIAGSLCLRSLGCQGLLFQGFFAAKGTM